MARVRARVGYLLLFLTISLAACLPPAAQAADNAPIRVFFTDPASPTAQFAQGGPDEYLQAAIENARVSVDVAIYDLTLYNIRDALVAAEERGVEIRMVVESDNFGEQKLAFFAEAGIPVAEDRSSASMHDKFMVIDRYEVWTGSMNYTVSDAYGSRNNLIRLRSMDLAANYEAEFEEMFTQHLFRGNSPANTPNREVKILGTLVETYFAPEDGVESRLVELVSGARQSISFMTYSFTSDKLATAILAAQARGVEIHGVMDEAQAANAGGEFDNFVQHGIDIRFDGEVGNMHNKVLIIDGEIVITGSYNFSANAERHNDENLLVIHDAELASDYLAEFQRIWDLANP